MKRVIAIAVAASAFGLAPQAYAVDYCVGSTNGIANIGNGNAGSPQCGLGGVVNQQAQNGTTGGTFAVSGNIFAGVISATVGRSGIAGNGLGAGDATITDRFLFTIPQTGLGNGSLTNVTNALLSATDVDFVSVDINGFLASISNNTLVSGLGFLSTAGLGNVPIFTNVPNVLTVTYRSGAAGSYGGNLTFVPVPEPTTWAMMLAGFAAIGFSMRRRQKPQQQVRFAF